MREIGIDGSETNPEMRHTWYSTGHRSHFHVLKVQVCEGIRQIFVPFTINSSRLSVYVTCLSEVLLYYDFISQRLTF